MNKKRYTHILQKVGVLKNFTVAKVVKKQDVEELKRLIRSITDSEEEYKEILTEELTKLSDMHDENNPIPGIIYPKSREDFEKQLVNMTRKFCAGLRAQNFTKREMAFLISAIISELGLNQEDFLNLKNELEEELGDEEPESEDDPPPKF